MARRIIKIVVPVAILTVTFFVGYSVGSKNIGNQEAVYGNTGLPKNCRALIAENIDGYYTGEFTADGALDSIGRNCGRYGYIWDEK